MNPAEANAARLKNSYVKTGMGKYTGMGRYRGGWALDVGALLLMLAVIAIVAYFAMTYKNADPHAARMQNKLDAVAYLNEKRAEANAPPLQLIELNVAKWRAEYIVRTGHRSVYDLEGRHPGYWYTRLDGSIYGGAKEVLVWVRYPNSTSPSEVNVFKAGINEALRGYWGHMLNPCYNYIAIEKKHSYERGWVVLYRVEYYVFWLVAKWIDWISPPFYEDGRFAAEGYAHPVMRPVAIVVYYSPYRGSPFVKNTYDITAYSLGDVIFCRYLDPPSSCNNAPVLNGTVVVSKMLDSGNWHVKIDVTVQLNKTGLYTFELIAQDLRDQNRKCPIMQYTVEVPPKKP